MTPSNSISYYGFRDPLEKDDGMPVSLIENETKESIREQEEFIRCRQCRNIIASPEDRISVNGSHHHTFANPHGIVFEIGCFKTVEGCGHIGTPSDEFTWFSGYSWRVALCVMCLTHLGWLFTAAEKENFHALIIDRLITR